MEQIKKHKMNSIRAGAPPPPPPNFIPHFFKPTSLPLIRIKSQIFGPKKLTLLIQEDKPFMAQKGKNVQQNTVVYLYLAETYGTYGRSTLNAKSGQQDGKISAGLWP